MSQPAVYALIASLVTGLGGVLLAGLLLRLPAARRQAWLRPGLSYATGVLLGASLLDMLPAALMQASPSGVLTALLATLVGLHVLERAMVWRHCHAQGHCHAHTSRPMVVVLGDGFHNLVDGLILGTAFLAGPSVGLAAALAIAAHEIPQEAGDMALLLESGMPARKVLALNAGSALFSVLGTVLALFAARLVDGLAPYALAIGAGTFLHLALADLLPHHRKELANKSFLGHLGWLALGLAMMPLVHQGMHALGLPCGHHPVVQAPAPGSPAPAIPASGSPAPASPTPGSSAPTQPAEAPAHVHGPHCNH